MKSIVGFISLFIFTQTACAAHSNSTGPSSLVAFKLEGVVNGGGGKGVQCGNTVRLLDLYEAELKSYPSVVSSGDYETDLRNYIYKLSRQLSQPGVDVDAPGYLDRAIAQSKVLISQINDIPSGQKLDFTDDATLPTLPSNCHFVQIASNFVDQSFQIKVYRDHTLWDLMPMIDQIALIIHEYTYWRARLFGLENSSDDTRKLISRMFTGLETYEMFSPLWKLSPLFRCLGGDKGAGIFEFFAGPETENGISGMGVYFSIVKTKSMSSRSRAFFKNLNPTQLMRQTQGTFLAQARNELLSRDWSVEIQIQGDSSIRFKMTNSGDQASQDFSLGACELLDQKQKFKSK